MPWAPLRRCSQPGCRSRQDATRCAAHARTSPRNHRGVQRQARGYDRQYEQNRAIVLAEQPYCRCGRLATTANHIVPVSRGGTSVLSNLESSCGACNYGAGARMVTSGR